MDETQSEYEDIIATGVPAPTNTALHQLSILPQENERYQALEQLVELLMEPTGRQQRAVAVALLRRQKDQDRPER